MQALVKLLPRVRVRQSPEQHERSSVEKNTAINKRTSSNLHHIIVLMIYTGQERVKEKSRNKLCKYRMCLLHVSWCNTTVQKFGVSKIFLLNQHVTMISEGSRDTEDE